MKPLIKSAISRLAAAAGLLSPPVLAPSVSVDKPTHADDQDGIANIVVTAQHREEGVHLENAAVLHRVAFGGNRNLNNIYGLPRTQGVKAGVQV